VHKARGSKLHPAVDEKAELAKLDSLLFTPGRFGGVTAQTAPSRCSFRNVFLHRGFASESIRLHVILPSAVLMVRREPVCLDFILRKRSERA